MAVKLQLRILAVCAILGLCCGLSQTASALLLTSIAGTHTVINKYSGMALDNPGNNLNSGIFIDQYTYTASANDNWTFTQNSDGSYTIINLGSGLALDDPGASTTLGVKVDQYTPNGTPAQKWIVTPLQDGCYKIANEASGLVLEVPNFSTSNNTLLDQWSWNGGDNQEWRLQNDPRAGQLVIVNEANGLAIDNGSSTAQGAGVVQWTPNGGTPQNWTFTMNTNSSWSIKNQYSGYLLDNPNSSTTSGQQMDQWASNNGTNQKWWVASNSDGSYTIWNVASNDVLDNDSRNTNGTPLIQWPSNGGVNQKWYLKSQSQPTFQNPLFGGDFPDVGILRVGSDFYMTHTSFAYGPGLVIWHSTDLVNWTPISTVFKNAPGSTEIWAPELVYSGGRYLVYFVWNGMHVCYANSPSGPWSAPIDLHLNDIDPGFVAGPNGTNYLYTAWGHVIQLSADGLSTVGSSQQVYNGWNFPTNWVTQGMWLEGPKLTQHGGYYYLICAEGGTAGPPTSHMAVVARSTSPLGPWQNSPYNPLIHTYSAAEGWWSVGHATLFSTPDGHWYIVYHGYRKGFQTLGRNTLMEPIEWTSDGWPHAPLGARRDAPMPAPMGVAQAPMLALSDDFQASTLKLTWQAWMETDMTRYQVGGGTLVMRAKGSSYSQSSPLTVRARDESYQVQVSVNIDNQTGATLGLEYNPSVAVYLELTNGTVTAYGPNGKLASISWAASNAWLKMVNLKNQVQLLVSSNGQQWQSLVSGFDASGFVQNNYGDFQAARPALSAIGSGNAHFSDFRYDPL